MISTKPRARGVLSLGRIYCDLVFAGIDGMPQLGREKFADAFSLTPGGGALITAAHLAGLGRPSALLARFGTDPLSGALEEQIGRLGLELGFLDRDESAGPQLTVVMVLDGDRAFLSRRAGVARPRTFGAALGWGEATHLHIAEYATLHEMSDAVTAAKAAGLTVSLDPSWDDELIRDPLFFERAAGVDVFLPNLEEARALTRCETPEAALAKLARHFPIVALKRGADGAMLVARGETITRQSPPVEVIDTTGAGDAFNAGFLDRWLDGIALPDCLEEAVAAGARSVQASGGTGSLRVSA